MSVAIPIAVAWDSGRGTDEAGGSPGATVPASSISTSATTTEPADPPSSESVDEPEVSEEPTPTPPSPEDEAFAAIEVDDCLSNHKDDGLDWNSGTPRVSSCSDPGSYYRVIAIAIAIATADDADDCDSDDTTWYHYNNDGSVTDLCLSRNYLTGQCMFATHEDGSLWIYCIKETGCKEPTPDKYGYIVQITDVYPDGAPDDACEGERQWSPDSGGAFCGDRVRRRSEMPEI